MEKEFKKGHTYFQWTFALIANITLLAYGIECGWISTTANTLQSKSSPTGYPLSENVVSWIASSLSMAAVIAVSIYSYVADTFGRKIGMMLIAVAEAVSWILKLSYSSPITLVIARLFSGLAAGGCFTVVPMYVKEISQDDIRGILGTLPMLLQTIGLLIIYVIGAYLGYFTVIIMVMGLPILAAILLIKTPESPAFLVKQRKINEAVQAVAFLRGLKKEDKIVQSIVDDMQKEEDHFRTLPELTLFGILKEDSWRRGFFIILFCFLFHGLNGSYAIMTYASVILISTGVKFDVSPEILVVSFPIVMIISGIVVAVFIEKLGRKPLLSVSFLISACSMSAIALMIILQQQGITVSSWLLVLAMMLVVAMYGVGISPIPYVIMTEMFSFQIRAKVMGVIVTFAWFMSFLLVNLYSPMCNAFGLFSPFIFYAVINFFGFNFTIMFVPETRGKSEEEISHILLREKERNIRNAN